MPSFDVVSKVEWHELDNALDQADREISQRFDFRNTETTIEKVEKELVIRSSTEDRARAALQVLTEKLARRKVSLKFMDIGKPEPTAKGGAKITIKVKEGIDQDNARKILALLKGEKLKVQAAIQGEQLRVSSKSRDELQATMRLLRAKELDIVVGFTNFRE